MKRAMLAAAARLLLLQGSMNYERLQGLGIALAMEPLIRDLDGGPQGSSYRNAMTRAARFFNTHPYLAGLAVGALARAEHSGVPASRIERLRSALKGPLGAVGDRLVWAGVLPVVASVGLVVAATASPWPAVVMFLTVYNAIHLGMRWWGLRAGWRSGVEVATALRSAWLQRLLKWSGPAAALSLGFALPIVGAWLVAPLEAVTRWGTVAVGGVTFVVSLWLAPAIGAARFGLLALGVALVVGWVW